MCRNIKHTLQNYITNKYTLTHSLSLCLFPSLGLSPTLTFTLPLCHSLLSYTKRSYGRNSLVLFDRTRLHICNYITNNIEFLKTFSSSLQCGCTKRKTEIREENPLHMCNIMCKQFFIKACAISFSFSLSFLNSLQILTSLDKQFHSSFIVFSRKVTDTCTPTLSVCLGRNGEMICLTHRMRWKEFATAGQHVKRSRKERREKQRERKTQKRLWGVLLICVIFSTFLFCDQSNRLTHSF